MLANGHGGLEEQGDLSTWMSHLGLSSHAQQTAAGEGDFGDVDMQPDGPPEHLPSSKI